MSDDNYFRKLEPAIIAGAIVIIENIYENIDSTINSVLFKEIYSI